VGDVAKVERQRFLPSPIYNAQNLRREMTEAERRREENRRAHAPRNKEVKKPVAERKKHILKVDQ
jgi:WD repeat and SOF domain-containing protein 1